MNGPLKHIAPFVAALLVAGCNAGGSASVPQTAVPANRASLPERFSAPPRGGSPACTGSRHGKAQCDAIVESAPQPDVPSGWGAPDIASAYNLPTTRGAGQIVAIVDAYDNPDVTSDLARYRSHYNLGPANFTKYNQEGQTSNYPPPDIGWAVEIDLDVEMVSAACPNCTIYLIEANTSNFSDLEASESEAVTLGAHIVSNSYSGTGGDQSYYDTAGVTYAASAGDSGYGEFADPADFGSVIAVGGTQLAKGRTKRGWTETVWSHAGAGCSAQTKPSWQHDPGCSGRTGDDVSAVADDVDEYDTYGENGWFKVGGTSVSSPLVAAIFGLAGNAQNQDAGKTFWEARHEKARHLNAVKSGSDGTCNPNYLCTAGTNEFDTYSGPTGWGTPNGIGAF